MGIKCCKGCQERHTACHKDCKRYLAEKRIFEKEKKFEKENRPHLLNNYDFDRVDTIKHKR